MTNSGTRAYFTRKSVATLLQEWAEANGHEYTARCDRSTQGLLGYFIDGERVGRDELLQIMDTGSVSR